MSNMSVTVVRGHFSQCCGSTALSALIIKVQMHCPDYTNRLSLISVSLFHSSTYSLLCLKNFGMVSKLERNNLPSGLYRYSRILTCVLLSSGKSDWKLC